MIRALLIASLFTSLACAGPAASPLPAPSADATAAEKEIGDKLDGLLGSGPDKDEAKWRKDVEDGLTRYFTLASESKGFNDRLIKYFQVLAQKQDGAALATFGKALAGGAPTIKMRLGMTLMVTQVLDMIDAPGKAVDLIRAAIEDPRAKEFLPQLTMMLANQLAQAKQYDEAATQLKALIKERPEPTLKRKLANVQLEGGKPKEALATLDEVLKTKQEKEQPGEAHVLAARAHAALSRAAEGDAANTERKAALALLDEVTAAAAKDAKALGFAGVVAFMDASDLYLEAGDTEKAKASLQSMQKLYTGQQETQIAEQKLASLAWIGKPVAAFAGPALDGADVKSSDFAGKIWVLDFWATWCGPCRGELPNVVKLAKATAGKPFAILSVSLDKPDTKDELKKFTKEHEMAWAHIYDGKGWNGPVCQQFEIHSIPATFLVDENMKIVRSGLRGEALEQAVQAQLARLEKTKKK